MRLNSLRWSRLLYPDVSFLSRLHKLVLKAINVRNNLSCQGEVARLSDRTKTVVFGTVQKCLPQGGRLLLFTLLPRRCILGNWEVCKVPGPNSPGTRALTVSVPTVGLVPSSKPRRHC